MRKKILSLSVILIAALTITACGGKESAASVAKKWCDLNSKLHKAAEGAEKQAAETALDKFEKDMEEKYKDNKSFLVEVGNEIEKCEPASEGR